MSSKRIKKMPGLVRFLIFDRMTGITLAPFGIYIRESHIQDTRIVNHELIHWEQQAEMFFIFFYIWYVAEWLVRVALKGRRGAYRSISFEKEAHGNDGDKDYLHERRRYAWINYLWGAKG